mmetsp:Transcript_17908/g.26503  ORF Transcript_17908/g.26503 Transcript_17908/m.26503 type:complete len:91 (+) Transcript_17908:1197-1469(+)
MSIFLCHDLEFWNQCYEIKNNGKVKKQNHNTTDCGSLYQSHEFILFKVAGKKKSDSLIILRNTSPVIMIDKDNAWRLLELQLSLSFLLYS